MARDAPERRPVGGGRSLGAKAAGRVSGPSDNGNQMVTGPCAKLDGDWTLVTSISTSVGAEQSTEGGGGRTETC